jgi:predicted nucleic acid-binding protein
VITRPEQLKASGLTKAEAVAVLDALVAVAEPIRLSFRWRPLLADPADDMVLETAVNGGADILVTFNHRHFRSAARQFEVQISGSGEALDRLRG